MFTDKIRSKANLDFAKGAKEVQTICHCPGHTCVVKSGRMTPEEIAQRMAEYAEMGVVVRKYRSHYKPKSGIPHAYVAIEYDSPYPCIEMGGNDNA